MADGDLQTVLLKKLEEYGESVLENEASEKKRKKKHKGDKPENNEKIARKNIELDNDTDMSDSKKSKKRKRKAHIKTTNNEEIEETEESRTNKDLNTGKLRHLESLKSELGLTEFKSVQAEKERLKEESNSKAKKAPEVVVFTSHKKKQKEKPGGSSTDNTDLDSNPEFVMRQARFEVRKFGIKGFQGEQKEEAMTSLLVRLGAKLPKNKFYNYKDYQEMRKSQMAAEKEKRELERKLGYQVAKPQTKKRKRDKNDVGVVDGQAGRWKSGVQFVKKNDLKGFRMSKIKF